MKLIGLELRKPTFGELTAAAVMACGLWLALVSLSKTLRLSLDGTDAGVMLVVIYWGCVCVRLGVRVDQGPRHLALNLGGSLLLVGLYQGVLQLLG